MDAPFYQEEQVLENALAGGLNSPQLSAADFNGDGLQDLYVFDRVGYTSRCFLNRGTEGQPDYVWAPAYEQYFPPLNNWVLLRDFNQDGAADIFAYSDYRGVDGVIIYRGYYEQDTLRFTRMNFPNRFNLLPYNFRTSPQVYITGIDYPAVDDVDCDGDLDILTFNAISPGRLEWYRNETVEQRLSADTVVYRLWERCWGGFFESGITPEVDLASAPGECVENSQFDDPQISPRHAGSTVLSLDIDLDNDRDLIIGDLSFSHLNQLTNGGDCEEAWINEQDPVFPAYDTPVQLPYFPAAFHLDVNNDGKKDLLTAPNADREAENRNSLWWYENIGTEETPDFTLRQKDFLLHTMVDLGGRTHPAVVDYNADGLPDLVVGREGYFVAPGRRDASLFLYENTGTATEPAFTLVDEDFLGMNQFTGETHNFSPAFGDLDGDGDLDLVVGEELGQLFFAENTAGPGRPMTFGPWTYGYQGIDVGLNSTPLLYDLNEDGLLDLIVGEFNGNINYFVNTGSREAPVFDPNPEAGPNQFFLGQIDARDAGADGYSAPLIVQIDGTPRLVTGTDVGRLEVYAADSPDEPFPLLSEAWGEIQVGQGSHPALADLDRDGLLEVVTGTARGGLELFRTDWEADRSVPTRESFAAEPLRLYPNPAGDWLRVELPDAVDRVSVQCYRPDGVRVFERFYGGRLIEVDLAGLPPGVYVLLVRAGDRVWRRRVAHY